MNVGGFIWDIAQKIFALGTKLYDVFVMKINIEWVQNILALFNADINLPNEISLYWLLGSASAITILIIIIYRIFK